MCVMFVVVKNCGRQKLWSSKMCTLCRQFSFVVFLMFDLIIVTGVMDSHGHFINGLLPRTVMTAVKKIRVFNDQELEGISPKISMATMKRQGRRSLVELEKGNIQVVNTSWLLGICNRA